MAKIGNPKKFEQVLTDALANGLRGVGIDAEISHERVPQTRLRRFTVIATKFKGMRPSERQDLVWRIADQVLKPDEQLQVSMILTLTPNELSGK